MEWTQVKCTEVLNNITGTIYDSVRYAPDIDYDEIEFLVRQGVLLMHMYTRATQLVNHDTIQECMRNMNAVDDHIHQHPEFIREYENTVVSNEHSDSIYVHYAISLKRYKDVMEDENDALTTVVHSLKTVTPDKVGELLPDARKKINHFIRIKKDVCASVFRLFEYVVEYEQLQKIMRLPSLPSYDPLQAAEEVTRPVQVSLEVPEPLRIPSQGPHLTPHLLEEEEIATPEVPRPLEIEDGTPPTPELASALPPPEPHVE